MRATFCLSNETSKSTVHSTYFNCQNCQTTKLCSKSDLFLILLHCKMEELYQVIPCRESQITDLYNLLGEPGEPLPYSIFLSGNTATGKTMCVEMLLRHLDYKHVIINCIECYSLKIMGETILNGLQTNENRGTISQKCDSLKELITSLNSLESVYNHYEPIVVVLDKAERLRTMDSTIMCTFLRLREYCNLNICTIFVTNLIYNNFYFKMGLREPIKIYFPNYNKEELFKIIFLHKRAFVQHALRNMNIETDTITELKKPELFGNFLNAFLSVFYRPCRDLIELRHMAQINFTKYCEPIVKKEISPQNLPQLWRHISPILKTSLELLYLRISSSSPTVNSPGKENTDWGNPAPSAQCESTLNLENTLKDELSSTKIFAQSFELPYYAKFLLIAAYLASYNPPKEDKRLFMKYHGKQRKRMQQVKAKAKISEKLNTQLGPKVFTWDRLLAIFYAILEEKIGLTSNMLSQISTLVELKLLAGGKELDLDCPKYKCMVGYDFISAVGQTVGFNVRKYLYDFF